MKLLEISQKIERIPKPAIVVASVGMVAVICIADYYSGPEISFSIFYLIAVSFASWYGGRTIGVLFCFLGAAVWLWIDLATGPHYSHIGIPVWNSLVRLLFFLIVSTLQIKVRQQMKTEEKLATTDPLTGLSNRRLFLKKIEFEIERAKRYHRPLTLTYIDLDNFKMVNDTRGHEEGDNLLCMVARVLMRRLRQTDITARMGGDEFAILFSETGYDAAQEAMKKCREYLLDAMKLHNWPVTFSIGVITFDKPANSIKEMIKFADDLMYEMKKGGKNNMKHVVWTPE